MAVSIKGVAPRLLGMSPHASSDNPIRSSSNAQSVLCLVLPAPPILLPLPPPVWHRSLLPPSLLRSDSVTMLCIRETIESVCFRRCMSASQSARSRLARFRDCFGKFGYAHAVMSSIKHAD